MGQLVFGMVENLLRKHFEDVKVVFADIHVLGGGLADVVNEGAPSGIPFVLDDLDQNTIAFGEDVLKSLGEVLNG